MSPEATIFYDRAEDMLARGAAMLGVGLAEDAGRAAYLAGFHAAQGLLFERVGRVFKTHHGVQSEFLRWTRDDPRLGPDLKTFLSETYNLKTVADYGTSPRRVDLDEAIAALSAAKRFVVAVRVIGEDPGPPNP